MKSNRVMLTVAISLLALAVVNCGKNDLSPVPCYPLTFTDTDPFVSYAESYTYNSSHQITATIRSWEKEEYVYDSIGRINLVIHKPVSGSPHTDSLFYDDHNRLVRNSYYPGGWTTYQYNLNSQITERVEWTPLTPVSTYLYQYPNATTHNPSGIGSVLYEYDNHPNPAKKLAYASILPDNNITKLTDPSNPYGPTIHNYTYNANGYAVSDSTLWPTASAVVVQYKGWTYECK